MEKQHKTPKLMLFLPIGRFFTTLAPVKYKLPKKRLHFVYPSGKPMIPHLPCCQGFAVIYHGFALGRLESEAPSTFALLGYKAISGEIKIKMIAIILATKKGITPAKITRSGTSLATPLFMKTFRPTGGVINPISRTITINPIVA